MTDITIDGIRQALGDVLKEIGSNNISISQCSLIISYANLAYQQGKVDGLESLLNADSVSIVVEKKL